MLKKISKNQKLFLLFSLIFLFCLVSPYLLLAQERELEVKYPEIAGIKPETVEIGVTKYVRYIFTFAVIGVGLILLAVLIWAGILYLTSAGQPAKLKEAKDRILSAFLGVILLLSAYLILYTINPQLVKFHFPELPPIKKVEIKPAEPLKPEEISLITLELPLGQMIEKGYWEKEKRTKFLTLIQENENFLKEVATISSLSKSLESLAKECRCEELKGLCTNPFNFSVPVGCVGDPCPKETRKKIEETLKTIQEKQEKLSEFQKKLTQANLDFQMDFQKYFNVEGKIFRCQEEPHKFATLAEHLVRLEEFEKMGWTLETITFPDAPARVADPLTFYCSVGGTILDYVPPPPGGWPEMPEEMEMPEIPEEMFVPKPMSCPVEIPLGQLIDQLKDAAIILTIKLDRVIHHQGEIVKKVEKLKDYLSQCTDKNCKVNCCCVPNPCYRRCKPVPGNICLPFCKSPCLQTVGGCYGKPCPYDDIEKIVEEIKEIDDTIFQNIRESKEIFTKVTSLIVHDPEEAINLKNIREAMKFCYSSDPEVMTWKMLTCDQALGHFGPDGKMILSCHPRNLYCCTSEDPAKIALPWQPPKEFQKPVIMPVEKYPPAKPAEGGTCPEGWRCRGMKGPQYNDASPHLKQLLACVRQKLDQVQKEKEIKGPSIGVITSITDSWLYPEGGKTCDWITGGRCQHGHYRKEKWVSCHYGGIYRTGSSYAVDFGAKPNEPFDYPEEVMKAVRQCSPGAYILVHYSNPRAKAGLHIHASLGPINFTDPPIGKAGCDDTKLGETVIKAKLE